jgi:hypothetical protein
MPVATKLDGHTREKITDGNKRNIVIAAFNFSSERAGAENARGIS